MDNFGRIEPEYAKVKPKGTIERRRKSPEVGMNLNETVQKAHYHPELVKESSTLNSKRLNFNQHTFFFV